jgi:hypothetical protein
MKNLSSSFLLKICFHSELLVFSPTPSSILLPLALVKPALENHQEMIEDDNVPEV